MTSYTLIIMGAHLVQTLVEAAFAHWALVSCVVLGAWLLRNRFYNGLNKYPGPFIASLTDWWRFADVCKYRPELTHQELHAKYGDVVRLGPNTLSFSDPAALKSIYGLNKGFTKVLIPPSLVALRINDKWIKLIVSLVRVLYRPAGRCQGP